MSIKIEVGRMVYYIREDSEDDKETNFYPPIGTLGIITEVCDDGRIVVNWCGNNRLNGGGYCNMLDVEYYDSNFFSYSLFPVLVETMPKDSADKIIDNLGLVIMEELLAYCGWDDGEMEDYDFDDDDIKFAIGRVLISKLGIDI